MRGATTTRPGDGDRPRTVLRTTRSGRPRPETDRNPVWVWQGLIAEAERQGDHAHAEQLQRGGPPPEAAASTNSFAPVICAFEVGDDPGVGGGRGHGRHRSCRGRVHRDSPTRSH
jgi:hypothetical protein